MNDDDFPDQIFARPPRRVLWSGRDDAARLERLLLQVEAMRKALEAQEVEDVKFDRQDSDVKLKRLAALAELGYDTTTKYGDANRLRKKALELVRTTEQKGTA